MIAVDTNLLLYAYVEDMPLHSAAVLWLEEQLRTQPRVGLPWGSLLAFVRLVSNPKVFTRPASLAQAWRQVELWLSAPAAWVPTPTTRHAAVLGRLLATPGLTANDVPDAHLAALAIEYDLLLCSHDRGFARFPGLRWNSPL